MTAQQMKSTSATVVSSSLDRFKSAGTNIGHLRSEQDQHEHDDEQQQQESPADHGLASFLSGRSTFSANSSA
jgi:hypothetical protein